MFGQLLTTLGHHWRREKKAAIQELNESKAVLQELNENNEDCSPLLAVSSLFEQSILLLDQVFNTTSYFRRKNVQETLIDDKSKVKEILVNNLIT